MKTSVENKIVLGFVASVLALAGIGWLSYRTMENLVVAEDWVSHTYKVIATLESGRAILTDAETAQRGYLLTGDESFLNDFTNAQAQVNGWIERLRKYVSDNPAQLQRLDKLQPLISQRLAILNDRIKLRQEGGLQAVVSAVSTREGKNLMDQIIQGISEMYDEENQLALQRQREVQSSAAIAEIAIVGGTALACAAGLVAILFIRRDLKLRDQSEAALEYERFLLKELMDNAAEDIYFKDREGRFLRINRHHAKRLGLDDPAGVVGKTDFDFFTDEHARQARDDEQEVMQTGKTLVKEEKETWPDGHETWAATIKLPFRDAARNIVGTFGLTRDITESKLAQEELDRFFALSLDFLCIASADGHFKRVSPAVTDILGWSIEEFLSRPFINFVHPDDHAATLREVEKQVVAGEKVLHFENRYQHKDGSWRVLSWRSIPQPGGLMYATARDVTERKHAEEEMKRQKGELETANKELEAFSYSVSHDLRAPLRHVDGFVDLLRKQSAEKLDERGRRYLNIIADSARQMGNLIDDLLIFSRMSRADLRRAKVASESLVHEARDALQGEIRGRVVWKIDSLPQVEADAPMLRQVWANLIGNAVKYSRTRDPAEIEIGCTDSGNGEFVFFVRDNGVGFDMQYVDKLFGVFQRLHRADEFEGTGIGLANVRRIISRHGGRTWADGKVDGGATFFFSLPKIPTETKG
jgi:PAS domain S-box-containing protein